MNDRELLELVAKAIGIELDWNIPPKSYPWTITGVGDDRGPSRQWNPLADDGDALRLANKLQLTVQIGRLDGTVVVTSNNDNRVYEAVVWCCGESSDAATRLAIVRAAAAIGKVMP